MGDSLTKARAGLTRVELLAVFGVLAGLVTLLLPAILRSTEWSRRARCQSNLRRIGLALHAYHAVHRLLPPAAVWSPGQRRSMALHITKRIGQVTYANWAVLLLPYLDEQRLAQQYESYVPVADPNNAGVRTATLSVMTCPSDTYNRRDNPFELRNEPSGSNTLPFARGNYAINGGSQNHRNLPGTSAQPVGDGTTLVMVPGTRTFQYWGNGVAGFNKSFSFKAFSNGLATTVAVDEIRAGVHPLDLRGAWALGQIGSSVTWAHGVNGDACGPNNPWPRSDDILGCEDLDRLIGRNRLAQLGMPCCWYCRRNQQATSRSQHPGGVNVLMADGAVRFVSNSVDPGLWHVMHSRETPEAVLAEDFDERLDMVNFPDTESGKRRGSRAQSREQKVESQDLRRQVQTLVTPLSAGMDRAATSRGGELSDEVVDDKRVLVNSVGMRFVWIPAGEFLMGIPDSGNSDAPPECPPHRVRITQPFYLDRFEVTQEEYAQVMGRNPSWHGERERDNRASGKILGRRRFEDWRRFPVEQVTWDWAAAFCRRVSALPAERAAGRAYRLPTEAEWEYACRAGKSVPHAWRHRRVPDDASGENAGIGPPLPIAPVGSYPPNAFGLHDMRGNVWEWCADWFDRDYYFRSPVDDPRGPAQGYLKVVRGGDWTFVGEPCKINYPITPPWKSSRFIGFRVVCDVSVDRTPE